MFSRTHYPDIFEIPRSGEHAFLIELIKTVHPHVHPRQRRLQLPARRPGDGLDVLAEPRHVLELVEDVRLHHANLAVGHLIWRDTCCLCSCFPGSLKSRPECVGYDLDESRHIQLSRP